MAKFIPIERLKKLREASQNGDESAIRILKMQLDGKDDFSNDLEEYFRPKPEPEPEIEVEEIIPEDEAEEPECVGLVKKLLKEELDAIESYSKAITQIMACESLEDGTKRKMISRFEEIKSDENEHYLELKQLLKLCDKEGLQE